MKIETKTVIIAGFPGVGKTHFYNHHMKDCADSDSSKFSWTIRKGMRVRNPAFPKNYISHIKSLIGKVKYIFVSSHKEVRDALKKSGLKFALVIPNINIKDEYVERFRNRGSSDKFIKQISDNWMLWLTQIDSEFEGDRKKFKYIIYKLDSGESLEDVVRDSSLFSIEN